MSVRLYILDAEFETGKHRIIKAWAPFLPIPKPESNPKTAVNAPHTVKVVDERYNPEAYEILKYPYNYYVDNNGDIWEA
jgi:hypothetical protein